MDHQVFELCVTYYLRLPRMIYVCVRLSLMMFIDANRAIALHRGRCARSDRPSYHYYMGCKLYLIMFHTYDHNIMVNQIFENDVFLPPLFRCKYLPVIADVKRLPVACWLPTQIEVGNSFVHPYYCTAMPS